MMVDCHPEEMLSTEAEPRWTMLFKGWWSTISSHKECNIRFIVPNVPISYTTSISFNYRLCCLMDDWLIPKTKWHSCLHNIALCNETGIQSSRAPRWQRSWTRDKNAIIKRQKHSTFWPSSKPPTSRMLSPDLLVLWFQIRCRSTDMCTTASWQTYVQQVI